MKVSRACLVLLSLLVSRPSIAQRQTLFQYTGVSAFSRSDCFAACWRNQDFATATANPNVFRVIGPDPEDPNRTLAEGPLWTRLSLIADNPSFEYRPGCANPTVDGKCIGTYQFPDAFYNAYTQTERYLSEAINHQGVSIPFPDNPDVTPDITWSGTVRSESVKRAIPWDPNLMITIQSYYSWDPRDFTTPVGQFDSGTDPCRAQRAYQIGWQTIDKFIPAYWDPAIERIVIPYLDMWHLDVCWQRGWLTKVTITNNSIDFQSRTYWLENHLSGGQHGHPLGTAGCEGACISCNDNEIELALTVPYGQATEVDAYLFHIVDDHTTGNVVATSHDTVAFIRADAVVAGTVVGVHLFPNDHGAVLCSGSCGPCGPAP